MRRHPRVRVGDSLLVNGASPRWMKRPIDRSTVVTFLACYNNSKTPSKENQSRRTFGASFKHKRSLKPSLKKRRKKRRKPTPMKKAPVQKMAVSKPQVALPLLSL